MRIKLICGLKNVTRYKIMDIFVDFKKSPFDQEEPILKELEQFVMDTVNVKTYTNHFPYQVVIQLEKARIVRHFKENQVNKYGLDQLVYDTVWNNVSATYEILGRSKKK